MKKIVFSVFVFVALALGGISTVKAQRIFGGYMWAFRICPGVGSYNDAFFWGSCEPGGCFNVPDVCRNSVGNYIVSWTEYPVSATSVWRTVTSGTLSTGMPGYDFPPGQRPQTGQDVVVRLDFNGLQNTGSFNFWSIASTLWNGGVGSGTAYRTFGWGSGNFYSDPWITNQVSFTYNDTILPQIVYMRIRDYQGDLTMVEDGITYDVGNTFIFWDNRWCGDGIINNPNANSEPEQCDDGNTDPSDGCDQCRTVPPAVPTCSVSSTISSYETVPYSVSSPSLSVGTNFSGINPMGTNARIVYHLSNTGVFQFSTPTTFDVPVPPGSGSLSYYYTSIGLQTLFAPSGSLSTLVADVYINGIRRCGATTYLKINSMLPWWQVGRGDFVAARGNLSSDVPSGKTLIYGEYWGLPIFDGTIRPNVRSSIGVPGWNADTRFVSYITPAGSNYSYNYFASKFVPSANINQATISTAAYFNVNGGQNMEGYKVYLRSGSLDFGSLSFVNGSTDKIIIFVDGNVTINGKLLLDDGLDYLMIIAKGNITVAASVGDTTLVSSNFSSAADVEGVFVTDGKFITNSGALGRQLIVRGTVIGWGNSGAINGLDFGRDLGVSNANYPSEVFDFAPDLLLNYPRFYSEKYITWKEVSP